MTNNFDDLHQFTQIHSDLLKLPEIAYDFLWFIQGPLDKVSALGNISSYIAWLNAQNY